MLESTIFAKTLKLSRANLIDAEATSLMSSDIDAVEASLPFIITWGSSVFEIVVGAYLLYCAVGDALFLGLIPVLAAVAVAVVISMQLKPSQLAWKKIVDRRMALTAGSLSQLQSLKVCGLTSIVSDSIHDLAREAISGSQWPARCYAMLHLLFEYTSQAVPLIILAGVYYGKTIGMTLSVAETLSTFALLSATSEPISKVCVQFAHYGPFLNSFGKIQKFLLMEELAHSRITTDAADAEDDNEPRERRRDTNRQLLALLKAVEFTDPHIVELVQASLLVNNGDKVILDRINLGLAPRTTTVIVGPTGCGKTAFIKTLIGEMPLDRGRILMSTKSVAYCGQEPWIENTSIRKNIVGGDVYDRAWYMEVLNACDLRPDFKHLPQGENTSAGVSGCNLNRDQKQRVALARALYSCQSVLILDDIFASLDQTIAEKVFRRLFCPNGIVKRCGTTVILATSLSDHITAADTLLCMDNDGGLTVEEDRQVNIQPEYLLSENDLENDDESPDTRSCSGVPSAQGSMKTLPSAVAGSNSLFLPDDNVSIYAFFKRFGTDRMVAGLLALLLTALLVHGKVIYLGIWMSQAPLDRTWFAGYVAFSAVFILTLALALACHLVYLAPASYGVLHQKLLSSVMDSRFAFLAPKDNIYMLTLFNQDMALNSQSSSYNFTEVAFVSLLIFVEGLIVGFGTLYTIALIPFVIIAASVVQDFYLEASRKLRLQDVDSTLPIYSHFMETVAGMEYIRIFRFQQSSMERMLTLLSVSQKSHYYKYSLERLLSLMADMTGAIVAFGLVFIALKAKHAVSQSSISLSLLTLNIFLDTLNWWVRAWAGLETSLGAAARINAVTSLALAEQDAVKPVTTTSELPPHWPNTGLVSFRNVSATYNVDDKAKALRDINLEIAPGMKLGLVGRSGSGKSSLLLTMLNLLTHEGQILIDGVDIREVPQQTLQTSVTFVPQHLFQMQGSVRDNLYPSEKELPSDEMMIETLTQVEIWECILPFGGLDANMSAVHLSRGQAQLFAIARAIIHHKHCHSSIIILDEATSCVDSATDQRVQRIIADVFKSSTVVMVAHRSETTAYMDYMLEMVNGRTAVLVDRGTWTQSNRLGSPSESTTESTDSDRHSIVTEDTYETVASELSTDEHPIPEATGIATPLKLPRDSEPLEASNDASHEPVSPAEESDDEFAIAPPAMAFTTLQLIDRKKELIRKYRRQVTNGQTKIPDSEHFSIDDFFPEPESLIMQVAGKWVSGQFVRDLPEDESHDSPYDDFPLASPPPSPARWRLDKRDSQPRSQRLRTDLKIELGEAGSSQPQSLSMSSGELCATLSPPSLTTEGSRSPEATSPTWPAAAFQSTGPTRPSQIEPTLSGSGMSLIARENLRKIPVPGDDYELDLLEAVGAESQLESERATSRSSLRSAIRIQRLGVRSERKQVAKLARQIYRLQLIEAEAAAGLQPEDLESDSSSNSSSGSTVSSYVSSPLPSPSRYNPTPGYPVQSSDNNVSARPGSSSRVTLADGDDDDEVLFLKPVAYERPKDPNSPTPAATPTSTTSSTTVTEVAKASVAETSEATTNTLAGAAESSESSDESDTEMPLVPRDALGLTAYDYLDNAESAYGQSTVVEDDDGENDGMVLRQQPPTGYDMNRDGNISPTSAERMWDTYMVRYPETTTTRERRRRLASLRAAMEVHERGHRRRVAEAMHANAHFYIEEMEAPFTPRLPGQEEEQPIPFSPHGYIDTSQVHLQQHVARAQQKVQRYVMQQAEAQDRQQAELLAAVGDPETTNLQAVTLQFFTDWESASCIAQPSPEVGQDGEPPASPFLNDHLQPIMKKRKRAATTATTAAATTVNVQEPSLREEDSLASEAGPSSSVNVPEPDVSLPDVEPETSQSANAGVEAEQTEAEQTEAELTEVEHTDTVQEENGEVELASAPSLTDDEPTPINPGGVMLLRYPDFTVEEETETAEAEAEEAFPPSAQSDEQANVTLSNMSTPALADTDVGLTEQVEEKEETLLSDTQNETKTDVDDERAA